MQEPDILRAAVDNLTSLLPSTWEVWSSAPHLRVGTALRRVDALLTVKVPNRATGTVVLEVRRSLVPRDVDAVVHQVRDLQQQLHEQQYHRQQRDVGSGARGESAAAVVAPWLSPRTRSLLEGAGIGYIDLTGNVFLGVDDPALFLRTTGAERNPEPPRGEVSLRGAAAGRVVRLLADVAPPYTPSEVSSRAGVSLPYASRLLTMLDREALITRGRRGRVDHVDWAELLRRRAEHYQVFSSNTPHGFISATGAPEALRRLVAAPADRYRAVTGSFAIGLGQDRVAAPSQLIAYVDDVPATVAVLDLIPADEGADVVLLSDFEFAVVDRFELRNGYRVVRSSQLALDCLTGNGRLPAEGEALLDWMATHEELWRIPSVDQVGVRAAVYQ